jgi:hypothetical protein
MYVDRFRFAREPGRLGPASWPLWRALVSNYRQKIPAAARLVADSPALLRAARSFADNESRAILRDLLIYRYLTPHLSRAANDQARFSELERWMTSPVDSAPIAANRVNSLGEPLKQPPGRRVHQVCG